MMTKAQLNTLAATLTPEQAAAAIRHLIDADPALARAALDAAIALYPVTEPRPAAPR
jgi:hypothetical protein